ncbi:MAG: hypothetical protein K9G60_14770, partial [Pseudolabrys sp.]|nr:hypothetical protein [Pseudolabrys sp.]
FSTMTAVVALIAGMSFAHAQNAATPNNPTPPPSSINAGGQVGTGDSRSGSQMNAGGKVGASGKTGSTHAGVTGSGKFCIRLSSSAGGYNCKFASMAACQKEAKPAGRKECLPNPNLSATTGMKVK